MEDFSLSKGEASLHCVSSVLSLEECEMVM